MKHFTTCVVGSGPASIALIGKLLDKNIRNICWIDPNWNGGRLSKYYQVPSNTKVKLFTEFGKVCSSFANVKSETRDKMEKFNPDAGCFLQYPCEMVVEYCDQLIEQFNIHKYVGCVTTINKNGVFELELTKDKVDLDSFKPFENCTVNDKFTCDTVYLTTGSKPVETPHRGAHLHNPNVKIVPLDIGLTPSLLKDVVNKDSKVAVIGNSHSAILVLRNLNDIGCQTTCFFRRPLKFAEYMDGWIKFDNTGLKGEAAEWAKNDLPSASNVKMTLLLNEEKQYAQQMPNFDVIIYSVGYAPRTLPTIKVNGKAVQVKHDPFTGQIYYTATDRVNIENMFGFGVAFPEQVTDKAGNVEMSVGMWKFMNYMKKVFPEAAQQ